MTRRLQSLAHRSAALLALLAPAALRAQEPAFRLEQILGFPFAADLVSAPQGQRIAWTMLQRGVRSVWVADGPEFRARQLVQYGDDGQELANLVFTGDGARLLYTRGGDHGSNFPAANGLQPDPGNSPVEPKLAIWSLAVAGGDPVRLAEGDDPVPSPKGDRVAFLKGREIWVVPADGSQPASRLFFARGSSESPVWSPNGDALAFVSNRGSLSYIAIWRSEGEPIQYLAPSSSLDGWPRWSPDGARIAFLRRPGRGGAPTPPLEPSTTPWAILVADVSSGQARELWRSQETRPGSFPRMPGGIFFEWAAGDRLVFPSYHDGWPHFYSIPAAGGTATALTPGSFMVEHVTLTPDRRTLVYSANAGADKDDIERRHLFRVAVDAPGPRAVTQGAGMEWQPVVTGDGSTLAYLAADVRRPPLPQARPLAGGEPRALAAELIPPDFPGGQLLVPEHVTFKAPDGVTVHGQLFLPKGGPARKPAIVFVHGGPPRQMLLGWHYMFYYSNSYAMNQYLASLGFAVLSVNYRLGIGYGFDFHAPLHAGATGASEYQDVLAGGKYLQGRPEVDPGRVGIWGGSYGGFLTAMALGRNSDVFAAGVDLHGVHDRRRAMPEELEIAAAMRDGVTRDQLDQAAKVAWESSPAAYVSSWKSPVLLIHGDDDRNVRVEQTVDLVQRLRKQGVRYEEMILPDEVHDFLLYRTWLKVNGAVVTFFRRELGQARAAETHR